MLQQTDTMLRDTMPFDTMRPSSGRLSDRATLMATLSCPQPDTTLCTVTGTLDVVTAPLLADTLTEAVHDERSHLVVDLSGATLLDAAGLLAVFEELDKYEIDGHLAVVVNPYSDAITRREITALHELLDMHRDLGGALRACAHASISTAGRHRAKTTY